MKAYQALTISALIHLLLMGSSFFTSATKSQHSTQQPVEIIFTPDESQKKPVKEIVDQIDTETIEDLKTKTNLLSKRLQRVKKQVIARTSGKSSNHYPQQPRPPRNEKNQSAPKKTNSALSGLDQRIRALAQQSSPDLSTQHRLQIPPSAISNHVPNIEKGEFSALNTDQFIYYAFYSRINEQIRNRWIGRLRDIHSRVGSSRLIKMSLKPTITEIEVILDAKGKYLETIVHRGSGWQDIDLAAINAFVEASPLNHPPEEMVKEDGKIHLNYSFFIEWNPNTLAHRGK